MSDEKDTRADQGVKFSQFTKVTPDPTKNIQMVGLRENKNVRADLTTDLVSTNSSVVFRDSKGRFKSAKEVPELNNQLEVNRFLWNAIEGLLAEPEAPELPADRLPIYAEDEPTEYPYAEDDEPKDLQADDYWYQVEDPDFDYDNPDPEGLDLHIWTETATDTFEWVLFVAEIPDGAVIIKDEAPDQEEDGVGNGSLWFDNSQDTMQLYVWHEDSDAWIPVAPPTTLEGRVGAGEATQQAIIEQITVSLEEQTAIRNKLAEVDQTVNSLDAVDISGKLDNTGTNILAEDTDWKIKQSDSSGNSKTLIHVNGAELGLYNLKAPTETHHAVTKEYVDSVGRLDLDLDLWTYSDSAADDLADGEFKIREESGGVLKIYMAQKNAQGWYYHPASSSTGQYHHDFVTGDQNGPPMTITSSESRCIHFAMPTKAYFNTGTGKYTRLECKYHRSNYSLTAGDKYMLNIPGLMAPVWGW